MRHSEQLSLTAAWISHLHARELAAISALLDHEPRLAALIQQDLVTTCAKNPDTGRPGLTGDQVLRIALARQLNGWTYAELAFHLADSASYRTFCRLGALEPAPSKSALAANLRHLSPITLEVIHRLVVTSPAARAVESGDRVRIDSTVVAVALHPPTDSALLVDGIRVLLRLLRRAEHLAGFTAYHAHLKRAKRRLLAIQHAAPRAAPARTAAYRDLLTLAQATADYASCALAHVEQWGMPPTAGLQKLHAQLIHYLPLVQQVIVPTTRRVVDEDPVPAPEKVVSLFEPHADVLVKDRRATYYGHKIFLTGGASGLLLDCAIVKGNPTDAAWAVPMLQRLTQHSGRVPRQASFDGGFASQANLTAAKALGVTDVCFAKRRNLAILDMVRSRWVYHTLRRFRAGIESGISRLKRVFGLDRCRWQGARGFVAYVRLGVLAANLLLLAQRQLTP
jgi:IS5 family transposase